MSRRISCISSPDCASAGLAGTSASAAVAKAARNAAFLLLMSFRRYPGGSRCQAICRPRRAAICSRSTPARTTARRLEFLLLRLGQAHVRQRAAAVEAEILDAFQPESGDARSVPGLHQIE